MNMLGLHKRLVVEKEAVFNETVTLASFPYMPRMTISRLYPIEIGDDYLLMSVSAEM